LLRARGRDQTTADSVAEIARARGRGGLVHARFEQRAGGLPVHGTYARVAIDAQGQIVNVVENLVDVPRSVARARITAPEAIAAAVANLYPAFRTIPAGFFRSAPTATRVAIPSSDGSMSGGFLVETWTLRTNELNESLVDGNGVVLDVELRTSRESTTSFASILT
jgi:hypothetical protein